MSPIFEIRTKYVHIRTTWFTDGTPCRRSGWGRGAGEGGGVRGRARGAADLPGESGGVGDALQHVGPWQLSPVGVNGALPGVDRAQRVALEAETVGAAARCFDCVVLLVALIPVHPSRGAGAGSAAGGGRVGWEAVVLLVRA